MTLRNASFLAAVLFAASVSQGADQPGKRIVLKPEQRTMRVLARVPLLNNQKFKLVIPETIGSRKRLLLNWPDVKINWKGPDKNGAVSCFWTRADVVRYTARVIPATDYVDIEMTITNLSRDSWKDVWAFNCLNPLEAPDFKDWKLQRTYMSAHGQPFLMADTTRIKGHMPTVQFYLHQQIPWTHPPAFCRGFKATSPDQTDGNWIVTFSDPPGSYMAATSLDSLFLFDNLDRCCIHSAPNFGDIDPGQSSTTVSRLYLAKGNREDFLKRYQADVKKLTPRQKWAQPKRPRLEIRGKPAPEKGQYGQLGFEIRAPWMKGHLQMRFPETVHSNWGLHFIDHHRADMPPLHQPDPFPQWTRNPDTGEISYHYVMPDKIEFAARVRPYEDEIVMEFKVINNSDKIIKGVSPNKCLELQFCEDFNKKCDLTNIYAWIDGKFTSLSHTTPTAEQKGRKPWPLVLTKEAAKTYAGPKDYPDGAWIVDQTTDYGLIARISEDEKHLIAVMWQDLVWLMTNTTIPCLHAGPKGNETIPPGGEHVWRGKIYLMENKPKQLLTRYLGDMGINTPSG